jgi:HEPN domain-containing protein
MNIPDQDVLLKVMQWVSYADDDLRLAKNTLETMKEDCPYHLVAYHAQQCVEKYLKAYLVYSCVDFPYTHDIFQLLQLFGKEEKWIEKIQDAKELTIYAVSARYPEENDKVTKKEAYQAISAANKVKLVIRTALLDSGVLITDK